LVQLNHKGHHQHFEEFGTYTQFEPRVGYWFLCYVRFSKRTGRPCFKIEVRVKGRRAMQQLGLNNTADLIGVIRDADAFWDKHMILAYADVGRYGRWLSNRRSNARRQNTLPSDYLLGGRMLRKFAEPQERISYRNSFVSRDEQGRREIPEFPPEHEKRTPPAMTMQTLVDHYSLDVPFIIVRRGTH
jgi:hypothetical protein